MNLGSSSARTNMPVVMSRDLLRVFGDVQTTQTPCGHTKAPSTMLVNAGRDLFRPRIKGNGMSNTK